MEKVSTLSSLDIEKAIVAFAEIHLVKENNVLQEMLSAQDIDELPPEVADIMRQHTLLHVITGCIMAMQQSLLDDTEEGRTMATMAFILASIALVDNEKGEFFK